MELWYLYNSGFAVKTREHVLIFDYYLDCPPGRLEEGYIDPEELAGQKVVVFVSHSHYDHYNHCIFSWREKVKDITYILSDEVPTHRFPQDASIHRMGPHQVLELSQLKVETLESTDLGVAFLVTVDGETLYHAGDLNWWHWNDESADANARMACRYQGEMDRLAGRHIDLAMVTVDPRQQENALLGITCFMEKVGARSVAPMHFGGDFSIFKTLKEHPRVQDGSWPILFLNRQGCHLLLK